LIVFRATPPSTEVVQFFETLFPGFWRVWIGAAQLALDEIDADAGGDTIITSWFRSPSQNRAVGGDPDSQHLVGLALDVIPGKGSFQLAVNEASGRFAEVGFIPVPFQTHLHVQTFPARVLREVGILDALSV